MKAIALCFALSMVAFVGLGRASTPSDPVPAAAQATDDDDDSATCAEKGDECLKGGAPKCCSGLRCVGYVCKK